MWLILWVCFAVFIFGFVFWTVYVTHQQKKAWKAFAARHKLKYESGKFMDSPVVTGQFGIYRLSLYTGIQQTNDVRGQRFVTVIELQMGGGMPTGGALATKEFTGFISTLSFSEIIKPALPEWEEEYVAKTRDPEALKPWLTDDRTRLLLKLFTLKNTATLLFFDEIESVLRIETSDPFQKSDHLEKAVRRLREAADLLKPSAGKKDETKEASQPPAASE